MKTEALGPSAISIADMANLIEHRMVEAACDGGMDEDVLDSVLEVFCSDGETATDFANRLIFGKGCLAAADAYHRRGDEFEAGGLSAMGFDMLNRVIAVVSDAALAVEADGAVKH